MKNIQLASGPPPCITKVTVYVLFTFRGFGQDSNHWKTQVAENNRTRRHFAFGIPCALVAIQEDSLMNRKVKVFVLFFAVIALAVAATAQSKIEDQALVARWTMSNTGGPMIEDFSGNYHFGTLTGAIYFKSDILMPSSVSFQDASSAIEVPDHTALEPARGTITMWIKADQLHRGELFHKVTLKTLRTDRRDGVGGAVYGARLLEDGTVQAYILNDDPRGDQWTFLESPRPLVKAGAWHHIAMQWDGKFFRLYVDGQVVAKKSYKEIPGSGLSYFSGTTGFYIAPGNSYVGQVGETRIYGQAVPDDVVKQSAISPGSLPR